MLAYSQGGASSPGSSAASFSGGTPGGAGAPSASAAPAPRTEVPTVQNALGAGISSAMSAYGTVKQYENINAQNELLKAQAEKVRSDIPVNQQHEIELKKRNDWLTQTLDDRITQVKQTTEFRKIDLKYKIEEQAQDIRMEMAKEHVNQAKLNTQLLSLDKTLTELGVPHAKNQAFYEEHGGQVAPYIGLAGSLMSGASSLARYRSPNRGYSQTYYDAAGNPSGGMSRNYQD